MKAEYSAAYPALYRGHWWWRVREEILLATVGGLTGDKAGRARILDVGCGAALFFDALEPLGLVEGIEADASAVARSGRWRPHITVGVLDDAYRPLAPFDVVLLLDLLEHVDDPVQVLASARNVLAPGGVVVITVPAFSWLWTSHDVLNEHVRRYDVRELTSSVREAGMAPRETRFLFQSLLLPKLLVRGREMIGRPTPHIPRVPAPLVNRFLTSWYRAENRHLGGLPFGGSILMVATDSGASIRS